MLERFNRTLKEKMWRYLTHVGGPCKWVAILPKLLQGYNAGVHRMIGMAPADVNKGNEFALWQAQQKPVTSNAKIKFKVGDYVRVSVAKRIFTKGYENQWSEEVFTVSKLKIYLGVPCYKIQDYEGTTIEGSFYSQELQKVSKPEIYRVEKVLQTKKLPSGQVQRLVKWVGYKQPTWTTSDIEKLL